jgi:hypothetical protein
MVTKNSGVEAFLSGLAVRSQGPQAGTRRDRQLVCFEGGQGLVAEQAGEQTLLNSLVGLSRFLGSDLLANLRPPRLVLVGEPDQLRVERAHQPLAFGARLVELAEEDRHVAADDDRTPARLDDDYLRASRVAWRRDEPEPRQQLELAVDGYVLHAGRLDPFADRVVVLAARVVELPALDVDRPAGEEVVAAAMVEVQVRVDDDVDAG